MAKRTFYVWGLHCVSTMLRFNPQDALELWIREHNDNPALAELATVSESAGLPVQHVSAKALDKLSGGSNHQGVVAKRRSPVIQNLSQVAESAMSAFAEHGNAASPVFLALDQVQDPQNLGACIRLADAAGVAAVILTTSGQAPLNGVVAKVASGAMDTVNIVQVPNLGQGLVKLKDAGVWIIGTDDKASDCYTDTDMSGPICLVLGSEGEGIRSRTRELCDFLVSIPIGGAVGSLNVSNAAAVCLFEAQRQRRGLSVEDKGV